jgi:hypothetical protein
MRLVPLPALPSPAGFRAGIRLVLGLSLLLPVAALEAQDPPSRGAYLGGQVTSNGEAPIAAAHVHIVGTGRDALTDGEGRYRISGIPAGEWVVEITSIGHEPLRVALAFVDGEPRTLTVGLVPSPIELEGIEASTRAALPSELQEFYLRRDQGNGHFFTREEIMRNRPSQVTDVIRRVPGVSVVSTSGPFGETQEVRMGRATGVSGMTACRTAYVVNGAPFPLGRDMGINTYIRPQEIAGIEVYTGASRVPARFNQSSTSARCGVVVIWLHAGG